LRSRQAAFKSIIIVVSIVAAVLVVEFSLRARGSYRPPANPINPVRPNLNEADPEVGYKLHPSIKSTYRYPHWNSEPIPVVSNSDGFRNSREFGESDGRRKVLVVGNSQIFGEGVRQEDRLTDQLESLEPEWRVDNLAMPGWGLDLMVRAIEKYGAKIGPEVTLLAIYTDDFRRLLPYYSGMGYAIPKFALVNAQLITVPYPVPSFWERLRIVQFAYQSVWERNRNRYDLNEALLNRFLNSADALSFKPLVAFLPGRADTPEDQERRAFLQQWTTRKGILYVDLTRPIHDAGVKNVYISDNWHWNGTGHRIAASELRPAIRMILGDLRSR
jgi:hypothetical protein